MKNKKRLLASMPATHLLGKIRQLELLLYLSFILNVLAIIAWLIK